MKKIAILAACLLFATLSFAQGPIIPTGQIIRTSGNGAPTSRATCAGNTFSGTSQTCVMSNSVLSSSDVIVLAVYGGAGGTQTISGCGATWTVDTPASSREMATGINPSAGACTVTASYSGAAGVIELAGIIVTGTAGIDQRGTTTQTGFISSGTTISSVTVTTTANNDLVLGLFMNQSGSNGAFTAGSGFSFGGGGVTGHNLAIEIGVKSPAGAVTPTATNVNGTPFTIATLALLPAGGAPAGPNAFVFVRASGGYMFTAGQTKLAFPLHTNLASGSYLHCSFSYADSGSQSLNLSDSLSNIWVRQGSKKAGTGGLAAFSAQSFDVYSSNAGADTVTATISSGTTGSIVGGCTNYTYSGTVITAPDATIVYAATTSTSGSNNATVGPITTSNSNGLIVADGPATFTGIFSAGTGWTARNDTTACNYNGTSCTSTSDLNVGTGFLIEDKIGAATGSQSATMTDNITSDPYIMAIEAF